MNRIQRDGLCLDSETGEHKLILSILLILSELYLDSEAGDPDSQSKWRSRRWRIESLFSVCSCSSPEPGRFRKAFMGVADDRRGGFRLTPERVGGRVACFPAPTACRPSVPRGGQDVPGALDRSRTPRQSGRARARLLPTVHVSYGRLYHQFLRCADHGCGMPGFGAHCPHVFHNRRVCNVAAVPGKQE